MATRRSEKDRTGISVDALGDGDAAGAVTAADIERDQARFRQQRKRSRDAAAAVEREKKGERNGNEGHPETDVSVAAVVKLGGAAITWKDTLETLNETTLKKCARGIAKAVELEEERASRHAESSGRGGRGGEGDGAVTRRRKGFVVVHGAGSFGHFQARRYGVSKGCVSSPSASASASASLDDVVNPFDAMRANPELLRGVAETRLSVTRLNHLVTSALVAEGVPAVGMSPFGGGWITAAGAVDASSAALAVSRVRDALASGLVPVVHGDVILDRIKGCAILSGDTLTQDLAAALRPDRAVFLTDVIGVFDRKPTLPPPPPPLPLPLSLSLIHI